jgi:predicted ATPase
MEKRMIFLSKIEFKDDVVFESNREDHKKNFKVKKRTYTHLNHRKSTYDDKGRRIPTKEKVTEKTFVIFPKGFNLDFKESITVIVGDNGCGKSSLLRKIYLPKYESPLWSDKTEDEDKKEFVEKYLKGKSRDLTFNKFPEIFINGKEIHKNVFVENIKNSKPVLDPMSVLRMWNMQESSNGENTLDFLRSLENVQNSLIMLDEPETSLSIKSQRAIAKILINLAKTNQLIIVTHAPVLMEVVENVYDFETKKYVDTSDYINQLYK